MAISNLDFMYIKDLIHKQASIVLDMGKQAMLEAKLTSLCQKEGISGLPELFSRLRVEKFGPLHVRVVESMTTNETLFFRDNHPFEALRKKVLPQLIAARRSEKKLRIWSAACSTGQEPYSIAMLLHEHFHESWGWNIRILATDFSEEMISRAKSGKYSEFEMSRGLPDEYRQKYFKCNGESWHISPTIQSKVTFQTINLAGAWNHREKFDIIFIRNVMIYFDGETKKHILERVHANLSKDGTLFLGTAESISNLDPRFQSEIFEKALLYRLQREAPAPVG